MIMTDTALFPLFANLAKRPVLVVGAGEIAERKIHLLLKSQALITVVAHHASEQVQRWHATQQITWLQRDYQASDLDQVYLAVAATNNRSLNAQIADDAEARFRLVNVVDDAELSSYQVPAIVDRAPLTIAISSAGAAPMMARYVRAKLETVLDESLADMTQLLQQYRQAIQQQFPELEARRAFYDWVIEGPVAQAVQAAQWNTACQRLEAALQQPRLPSTGQVILVGAGSGDPGLLTLHGLRALNQADVILYDRLVSDEILELARRDATQVYVGKKVGEDHHATQARIHQLMLDYVAQGLTVVRLKGGDAFVFGRGGEELSVLRAHQVPYRVVPGITAALACGAYSGIPLTHREYAQGVQLITGHQQANSQPVSLASSSEDQTLVVYMGLQQILAFSQRLLAEGRAAETSCALIENGSRPNQRVLLGELAQIPQLATEHAFKAPSLLVVGDVAALAAELHWFGQLIDARGTAVPPVLLNAG